MMGYIFLTVLMFSAFSDALINPIGIAQRIVKKIEMESFANERKSSLKFVGDLSKVKSQRELWESLAICENTILAFSEAGPRDMMRFYDLIQNANPIFHAERELRIEILQSSPVDALIATWHSRSDVSSLTKPVLVGVNNRMKNWVNRTLVKLNMCPFTQNSESSGQNLEEFGVYPAPIQYVESDSTSLIDLMIDFWGAIDAFIIAGEAGASSIIMSVPHWDDKTGWDEWHRCIFPLLEESVVTAKLSRTLGIVCFHPLYSTPDSAFLLKHRFGHMYSPEKLLKWVQSKDPKLAEILSLQDLQWAGSYQRRSPHAMINVLWASQLEAAENKRDSNNLYVRNVKRLLREGKEKLDKEAENERVL